MKKQNYLVFIFTLFLAIEGLAQEKTGSSDQKPVKITLSVIAGISLPKKTLEYKSGVGIKCGVDLNRIYVGIMASRHQGDKIKIKYGDVPELGIEEGVQNYSWNSLFLAGDAGYNVTVLSTGSISAILRPYASAGLGIINMSTSGVYGESDNAVDKRFRLGAGVSGHLHFGDHFALGVEYRMYAPADASFRFDGGSKHGFSTGIYYDAFFSVFSYRFP